MRKKFNGWMILKDAIHNSDKPSVFYKQREIWWVSIGRNVGFEEDGKGEYYSRPVLVIKGFSKQLFWGVPLSTTKNRGIYYHEFIVNDKTSVALLSQLRTFDTLRLVSKYGTASQRDFDVIKNKIKDLIG
jgi:mRNA interferase MazF